MPHECYWLLNKGVLLGTLIEACLQCEGKVKIKQFDLCPCKVCGKVSGEIFEYSCCKCGEYNLTDYFTVSSEDLEGAVFSFPGLGFPIDDPRFEVYKKTAIRQIISQLDLDTFSS